MDQQKKIIKSITRTINRWAWLNQKDAKNNPQKEKISRYSLLLEEICNKALHLASTTGNRASPPVGDLCAVLLLPDHQKEHFHATTCVGPSAFKSALINHKPPFFKPAVFRDLYNKYHSLSQKNDSPDPSELLRQFRRDSEDCISSTGVIYEIEKRISFEDLHHRCLAFRFEFMERIERAERKSYKFRQLIGIPINILGRKIGVLLLMSHRPKQFYPYDSIYWILSDLMGMAIAAGIQDPELKPFFPEDLSLEQCPFLDSEADISERREEAINVLNGVKYDFSVECP